MAAFNQDDELDGLIKRYLTVNGMFHAEAYEVILNWYTYLNALSNATGQQLGSNPPNIGLAAVELAFETPIAGFIGNTFWQQHGHEILPLVSHDIVQHGHLTRFADKPDLVLAVNVIARYGFIGQVIALVRKDGFKSWRSFEQEFRTLMERLMREQMKRA